MLFRSNKGPVAGGDTITIAGSYFTGATSVKFGTASATFTVTDDSTITATVPAGSVSIVDVTVTTVGGTSSTSGTGNDYRYFAVPTVASLSTQVGPIAGGTAVTISGSNLDGVTSVTFGGAAATSVVVVDDSTLTLVTPARPIGSVDVVVTTPGGVATATKDRKSTRLNSSHT